MKRVQRKLSPFFVGCETMHTSENVNTPHIPQLDAGIYEIIVFFNGKKYFLYFVKLD